MRPLALTFLLALAPDPGNIQLPTNYQAPIAEAVLRAEASGLEEFYCLIGYTRGDDVIVTGMMKPWQRAWNTPWTLNKDGRWSRWFVVEHGPCPSSAVADFHTHPEYDLTVHMPSSVDLNTWFETAYNYHIIGYVHPSGEVHIIVWDHLGNGQFKSIGDKRVRWRP